MLYRYVDAGWIFDHLPFLATLLASELLLGAAFLALTASLIAFGVPGVLLPISFTSGALLGSWAGMAVVVTGAMLGSHALFLSTRIWLGAWMRKRGSHRLERLDQAIAKRGFVYLLGLRLVGAPHLLVTVSSALSAMRTRSFALATLLGFLPAVALAANAGAAI